MMILKEKCRVLLYISGVCCRNKLEVDKREGNRLKASPMKRKQRKGQSDRFLIDEHQFVFPIEVSSLVQRLVIKFYLKSSSSRIINILCKIKPSPCGNCVCKLAEINWKSLVFLSS